MRMAEDHGHVCTPIVGVNVTINVNELCSFGYLNKKWIRLEKAEPVGDTSRLDSLGALKQIA